MNVRLGASELLSADLTAGYIDNLGDLSEQAVAANLTSHLFIASGAGVVTAVTAKPTAGAAAGESMTVDVFKNGATIMTALATINQASGTAVVSGTVDPAKQAFVAGDVFTLVRTYVAGGGPTPIGRNVACVKYYLS